MSTVITNGMLSLIDARLRKCAFETRANIPMIYDKVFRTLTTERRYEIVNRVYGVPQASIVNEGAIYPQQEIKQDSSKTIEMKKFGFRIDVTRELIVDNLFEPIQDDVAKAMKNSMDQTKENRAMNVLNNSFTTQLAQDGLSLINTAHTLGQGGTQTNRSATDASLDIDALWEGRNTMKTTKGNSTLFDAVYDAKWIVVPQQLERRANELIRSEWLPQVTENTANVISTLSNMMVATSPLLTSTTGWWLVADSSSVLEFALRFWQREPLQIVAQFEIDTGNSEVGVSTDADIYSWKCRERYETDSPTWFGIYGSAGDDA